MLSVLHRKYRFGGDGLPQSVVALGREMLSAPIAYACRIDGRDLRLESRSPASLRVSRSGASAKVGGLSESEKVRVTSTGRFEYDGFLWNDIELAGAGRIERMTLEVPFNAAEVPLFHAVAADTTGSLRHLTMTRNPPSCLTCGLEPNAEGFACL